MYEPIYIKLYDFPTYSNSLSEMFETKVIPKSPCCNGFLKNTESLKNTTWAETKLGTCFKTLSKKH